MFNEYWQACNYAKLLKCTVTTPCLSVFLQRVFFNSSLQSLHHLCDLLLNAFQYVHVCCPVKPRNGCSSICFMCSHPQCWMEGKDHPSCWQCFAAQGTIVPTRAHCSLIQLGVHWDSQILLCQAAFQIVSLTPCIYWSLGLFFSRCRALQFPWLSFRMLPSAHFCSLLRSPQMHSLQFCHQPTCWELCWAELYAVLTDCWGTPRVGSLTLCHWSLLSDQSPWARQLSSTLLLAHPHCTLSASPGQSYKT